MIKFAAPTPIKPEALSTYNRRSVAHAGPAGRKVAHSDVDVHFHPGGDGYKRQHGEIGHGEVTELLLFLEEFEAGLAEQVGMLRDQLHKELFVPGEVLRDLA